ncbi:Uncharacterised protein [uncultured archaeon]|nr:Uncharacterised protein [uncultured archaeon]
MDESRQTITSDGNRTYVGNFDAKGLNLNNNWDDNRNDNLGVSSARNFYLIKKALPWESFFLIFLL